MIATVHSLCFHIVFSTSDRRSLITPGLSDGLYRFFSEIIRRKGGVLVGAGGIPNHVHLLARLPPSVVVSEMIGTLKAESARWARVVRMCELEWDPGYGVFSVGKAQGPEVLGLLKNQERHHVRRSYAYELLALMNGSGIQN